MKKIILIVILLLLILIYGFINNKNISEEDIKLSENFYNDGIKFSKNLELDKAIEMFDKAINLYPKKSEYFFRKGIALLLKLDKENSNENIKEGVRMINIAINTQEFPIYYETLARFYLANGDLDNSMNYLNKGYKFGDSKITNLKKEINDIVLNKEYQKKDWYKKYIIDFLDFINNLNFKN